MIRRPLFPSVLALSFLVGCAGEESAAPDATPAQPISNPTTPSAADVRAGSVAAEAAPADATKPAADAKAPAAEEKKPEADAKAPAAEEKKPAADAKAPAAEEKKPAADAKAPAAEEKKADAKPSLEGPSAETGTAKLSEEDLAEIKKLPADEQAAILAQVACPVSEHGLGSMGAPIKVSAEGRTFYLCCESCQKKLKADPKAVIAELDKLIKK